MTYLHANEFADRTNLPLKFIKRACKAGQIPHIRIGNKYLLDDELALAALLEIQKQNCPAEVKPSRESTKEAKSFLEGLKNLRKEATV